MLKRIRRITALALLLFLIGCGNVPSPVSPTTIPVPSTPTLTPNPECPTYNGYGRYTMKVDCESVVIEGVAYTITRFEGNFMVGGHSFTRGIYHKTRPWLYVHQIDGDVLDITFDAGKDDYPLYTGSSGSIGSVYEHDWDMTRSTCANFAGKYWLVSHRWSEAGIFFDLQLQIDPTDWSLVQADIFVPYNGPNAPPTAVSIPAINTTVAIISFHFDPVTPKASVRFKTP